jgi:hypothetical protein
MKRRFLAGIVAILMAIPLLIITAGPASATCVNRFAGANQYTNVLDDELNGHVEFYEQIFYTDCGNYRIFRYVKIGYSPDSIYNDTLRCGSSLGRLYRVRMNFGALLGHNPDAWEADCVPTGNYRIYDWADVNMWDWESGDRCAGTHWTAVLNNWPDQSGDLPVICF